MIKVISDKYFEIDGITFLFSPSGDAPPSSENKIVIRKPPKMLELYLSLTKEREIHNVLEIGTLEGGSAIALYKLLKPKKIVSVDIAHRPYLNELLRKLGLQDSIKFYFGISQDDKTKLRNIVEEEFGGTVDLVIDDASHSYELTKKTFEILFPFLKPNGFYVIEDWGWAHNMAEYRVDETPLTNLIFEIIIALASNPSIFRSIRIMGPNFAVIQKGQSVLCNNDDFKLDNLMRIYGDRKYIGITVRSRSRQYQKPCINYHPNDDLEFFRIDVLNANLLNGRLIIGGLALPKADVENLNLTIKDAEGIKEAQWGLPSPVFGEQRKDNPKAKNARFRIDNVVVGDEPIEVLVNGKKVAEIYISF